MSDLKTAGQPDAPLTGHSESHEHPVDFNQYLRPCAHEGCEDMAGADLDGNLPPVWTDDLGRIVRDWYDGDPVWCWYHASPMWVKRRQRSKAK